MEEDFMKRGYLLPEGCKDLFDALKLKFKVGPERPALPPTLFASPATEVEVLAPLSVKQLATLLGQKPAQIVFDLIKLGVYVTYDQELDFEMISKILQQYGFNAKRIIHD